MTGKVLGWLDTNIFVHALFKNDPQHDRCRAVLQALQDGRATGWVDVLVVHELTYVLGRLPQFTSRAVIHEYIRGILAPATIHADDKQALLSTLARWATENVGFADARLAVLAQARGLPICSANQRDFTGVTNSFVTVHL
ncbi:MAG TPA: PIN domain-containing protein [Chloroflexota bacterium]|nr:PIN domain-containing protein [Chloroflexota bacterium]